MPTDAADPWTQATFEAAEEAMLAEGARLSLEENLLWIQDINRFAALLKPMAAAPETGEAALTRKSTISARTSFARLLPSL